MELWFNLIVSITVFILSIVNLKNRQRFCGYLLPGWIIVILVFIYFIPGSLLYAINPDNINSTFERSLNYDSILGCQSCATVVLVAYYFSELFCSRQNHNARGRLDYILRDYSVKNTKYKIVIVLLLIFSIYFYFKRWNSIGGVATMLVIGRADAIYEMESSVGGFARYDILLFLAASFFIPYIIVKREKKDFVFILLTSVVFVAFFVLLLAAGTRLPIVSIALSSFAFLYTYRKNWLKKKSKIIIIIGILFYLTFNVYSFYRSDAFNLLNNLRNSELSYIQILFPNETLTSYLSYDAMRGNPYMFYEDQFLKVIPNSIRNIIGLDPFIPYSERLRDMQNTVSTLTIPLPIDLYFGSRGSYILLFILAFVTFILINSIFKHLALLKYGVFIMIWLYILAFYFIRTEAVGWVSRGLLMCVIGFPILLLLNIRSGRNNHLTAQIH